MIRKPSNVQNLTALNMVQYCIRSWTDLKATPVLDNLLINAIITPLWWVREMFPPILKRYDLVWRENRKGGPLKFRTTCTLCHFLWGCFPQDQLNLSKEESFGPSSLITYFSTDDIQKPPTDVLVTKWPFPSWCTWMVSNGYYCKNWWLNAVRIGT